MYSIKDKNDGEILFFGLETIQDVIEELLTMYHYELMNEGLTEKESREWLERKLKNFLKVQNLELISEN